MKDTQRNLRKAAVLIASLDEDHAEALLAQMPAGQAVAVRRAIRDLGDIDPQEQHVVIEEFFRVGPLVPDKQPSGIELDDRLPNHLSMSPPSELAAGGAVARGTPAFRFLHEAPLQTLAHFLEREHPQTVAVVVSHLPAERAAEILGGLPPAMQLDVARRLVDLDEADPEILCDVERELETWLCQQVRGDQRRCAGLAALNNILGAASPRAKEHITANLARHDRQLATRLKLPLEPELSFADLEQLDGPSLATVLRHVPWELRVLALAGSGVDFSDRACGLLGPEEGDKLAQALRQLGPTRLSDVEEAQREVAATAQQLALRGEISAPRARPGRLSIAV